MPSLRGMQLDIPTLDIEDPPLADLFIDLGAIIVFDGTLTDDETPKLKNLGSGGSALDATITDLTINENGMVFNASSTIISVPSTAAFNALTDFTHVYVMNPGNGEGASPRLWNYGNSGAHLGWYVEATNAIRVLVDYNTTDSDVQSAAGFITANEDQTLFVQHRSSDRLSRFYKGYGDSVIEATYGASTAGVGTIVTRPDAFIFGNSLNGSNTWANYFKALALFGRELDASERLQVSIRAGTVNPT